MDNVLQDMAGAWPEDIRAKVFAADRALMERVPGMAREIDPNGRLIGYMLGPGYKGTLFTILVSKSGVKVGFSHGATLPDPAGMLGGSGKVHRTLTVGSLQDVDNSAFLELVDAARAAWQERYAS